MYRESLRPFLWDSSLKCRRTGTETKCSCSYELAQHLHSRFCKSANYATPRTQLVDFFSDQMRGPEPCRIVFLGASQTGKSTLCNLLSAKLAADPNLVVLNLGCEGPQEKLCDEIKAHLPLPTPPRTLDLEDHVVAYQSLNPSKRLCLLLDEFTRLERPGLFLSAMKPMDRYIIPTIVLFGHPTPGLISTLSKHSSWETRLIAPQGMRVDPKLGAHEPPFTLEETVDLFTQWAGENALDPPFGKVIGARVYELALGHVGMTASIGIALDRGSFRNRPVAEFLRAQAAAAAAEGGRQPGDVLLSALADYTSSPEFLNFLVDTPCSAQSIITQAERLCLLPTLYRVLAPCRPITRADPHRAQEGLAAAVAIGALILEGAKYRVSSPILRSLVLWQLNFGGRRVVTPSSSSSPPPPLFKIFLDALQHCDLTVLQQPESRTKRYHDPGDPEWHCLREYSLQSSLFAALSKQARSYGCYCVPEALVLPPPDAPGRPAPVGLIRHGEMTQLIELAMAPLDERPAYFERLMTYDRLNPGFLRNALLVFFEPEPASPKAPDLTTPNNEAARQAIAVGQLQVIVVRFDKDLTRFQVYDPAKQKPEEPEIVSPRQAPTRSPLRGPAASQQGAPAPSPPPAQQRKSSLVLLASGHPFDPPVAIVAPPGAEPLVAGFPSSAPSPQPVGVLPRFAGTRHGRSDLAAGGEATSTEGGDIAPRKVTRVRARPELVAVLPKVEARLSTDDQQDWNEIRDAIFALCCSLDDLRALKVDRLRAEGIPGILASRVVTAISQVLTSAGKETVAH
ncbi:hypothetical protein PAPYR_7174 [Paratrimastix pyriformis]|uniref:AAA+ ATPase domain-containing protein n=1 Tax=Paratrimastix pyriformis TaxID=342808 RepID=A0ABQ8UDM5_9EUKA|nr:hypothetical protein PAPYR_7174 [Paratrimastix pyriformis]